jgi:hypothetical protein
VRAPLLGVAAATLLALPVPPASAVDHYDYAGGCTFDAVSQPGLAGSDGYTGVLGNRSITYRDASLPTLVDATVTCELWVNGIVQNPSNVVTTSGYGVQAGAQPTTFHAAPFDTVQLCLTIAFEPALPGPVWRCAYKYGEQFPPKEVTDIIDVINDVDIMGGTVALVEGELTSAEVDIVDPVLCPRLAALAPGAGGVGIDPTGDVTVPGLGLVWDCPPYGP